MSLSFVSLERIKLERRLAERSVLFEVRGKNLVVLLDKMEKPPSFDDLWKAALNAGLTPFKPARESKTFMLVLKRPVEKGSEDVEEQLLATFKERKALIFHDYKENAEAAAKLAEQLFSKKLKAF